MTGSDVKQGALVDGLILQGRAPSSDGVSRWRVVASDTGTPGELLSVERDDGDVRSFLELHRRLSTIREAGVIRVWRVAEDERRAWVVRDPVDDHGLERVHGPLDPAVVAWIGASLLPAVLAAGPALGGTLRLEDLALTAAGHPVLAPRGPAGTRLRRDLASWLAPETAVGPPDAASAAYPLGVVLWVLATGRAWSRGHPETAPIAPGVVRPGVPPGLDRAVLALLSADPGHRPGALPWLLELARPEDLRRHQRRHPSSVPIQITRGAPSEAKVSDPSPHRPAPLGRETEPAALVLLPADRLATLSPAQRSLLAGLASVPESALDDLAAKGLPVVVEPAPGRSAARRRATALATSTGLPLSFGSRAGVPDWIPRSAGAALAATVLAVGIAAALLGWLPVLLVALALAAAALGVGGWSGRRLGASRSALTAGLRSRREVRGLLGSIPDDPALAACAESLARLRRALASTQLPGAVEADVRSASRALERELAQLASEAPALPLHVDRDAARSRLAVLDGRRPPDPLERSERDRLARTLSDLDAVEERRRAWIDEPARRLSQRVASIEAALLDADPDDESSLDRLAGALRDRP